MFGTFDLGGKNLVAGAGFALFLLALAEGSGAQRKKALYLVNGKWYEPRGKTPSTHNMKPPIVGLAGQVENEMFYGDAKSSVDKLLPMLD